MRYLMLICLLVTSFASAASYSGSIAIYKKTGITGFVRNLSTDAQAIKGALALCNKKNKIKRGCVTAVTVSNGCAAVAWSKATTIWNGEGAEDSLSVAKQNAISACNRRGANDCKIIEALCTSWETWETTSTLIWW